MDPIKLFLLCRNPDDVGYDQAAGYVVAACDETQARELAFQHVADDDDDDRIAAQIGWKDSENSIPNDPPHRHPVRRCRSEDRQIWLTHAACTLLGTAVDGTAPGVIMEDHIAG